MSEHNDNIDEAEEHHDDLVENEPEMRLKPMMKRLIPRAKLNWK